MRRVLGLAFATVCGLLSCGRNSTAKAVPSVDDMRQIEEETHLKFPASARVLMWDPGGRMDSYLRLKVEMAAADWPAFIAASPFRAQPLAKEARASLGLDDGAWGPGTVADLLKGQVWLPNARSLNLGADLSRPDVVVVYVRWFET
ncbi:MAG TPA: hypothetical protein VGY54_04585 [Polyangiaceae bacterium]|nr:hypothetical protein [Polyangiaceae bacterium]